MLSLNVIYVAYILRNMMCHIALERTCTSDPIGILESTHSCCLAITCRCNLQVASIKLNLLDSPQRYKRLASAFRDRFVLPTMYYCGISWSHGYWSCLPPCNQLYRINVPILELESLLPKRDIFCVSYCYKLTAQITTIPSKAME